MPLDHFTIVVPDGKLEEMVSWLLASNAVFGFEEMLRPVPFVVGMGEDRPYFWVFSDPTTEATEAQIREWRKQHIAFTVESMEPSIESGYGLIVDSSRTTRSVV